MKIFITTDTHFGHTSLFEKLKARPPDFERRIHRHWRSMIRPEDLVIHLGDVVVGKSNDWNTIIPILPGRKILVMGNHDKKSASWYMKNGFSFCCENFTWRIHGLEILFSHKPMLHGTFDLNVHGHLHGDRHRDCLVDHRHYLLALEKTHYQPSSLKSILEKWTALKDPVLDEDKI